MTKSQFNIKISKDLLTRFKRQAIKSGKSLTEHITDLITNSLSESGFKDKEYTYDKKIDDVESRLLKLESIVRNREYISQNIKPFTNSEAINCTNFMRGVFYKQIEKRKYENKSEAFDEFLKSFSVFDELNKPFSDRLREIMLSDKPNPWTGEELNKLSVNDKCNCPIRRGLINWTGVIECPSQQEICDKGEELISLF